MTNDDSKVLFDIARQAMIDRDLLPEFSPQVADEVAELRKNPPLDKDTENLRGLPWVSVDNDDTLDIDQVSHAVDDGDGRIRLWVAIADVDWLVDVDSAIDRHAAHNTTTVYTPVHNFLMLPPELCTDRTSLSEGEDRMGMVIEMVVENDGELSWEDVYPAQIRNHSKLAYDSVSDWLDGTIESLDGVTDKPEIDRSLRLHDQAASRLFLYRHQLGALDLHTIEPHAVIKHHEVVDLVEQPRNRGRLIIENLMIAANGITTRYLQQKDSPTFRRVVREPRRWDRIMSIAEERGWKLAPEPDSKSLDEFLSAQRERDPVAFPDLSLTIVKLIGSGEYAVEVPGGEKIGHFGLAVQDYSHSTAPNRRFPDLVTHRLLKAAMNRERSSYSIDRLHALAARCTEMEDEAKKVERRVRKSASALLLRKRIGQRFEGIVTGASDKGTWVRVFQPPVEGKVMQREKGLDVGDRVRVKLIRADVDRGYIDFARV